MDMYLDSLMKTKLKARHRSLVAILCGGLLASSGCGIPCRRGPLPGPPIPQFFSWNNGVEWRDDLADSAPPAETSDDGAVAAPGKSVTSTRRRRAITLVNFAEVPPAGDLTESSPSPAKEEAESPAPAVEERIETPAVDAAALDAPASAADSDLPPAPLLPVPESQPALVGNSSQMSINGFFDDPFLIDLIRQAMAGNQELRILAEEIQIVGNEVQARSGEYLPFVTFGAGAGVEKSSRFTRDGAVEDQLEAAPGRGFPEPLPDFMVATNISWELDVWRKLRNAKDAAAMRYLGTAEGRNYIVTRLAAEVAENYYALLALDNRLDTLNKTVEIQQRSLEIAQAKKEAGRGTELAVQRFQAEVRKNQSERTVIQQEIVEVENRINFLVGRYPQPIDRMSVEFIDLNLSSLAAGVPSDLLRNRADIRQAEREVAAAGLDLKVARARFYPSFGLNAGVGLNAYNMRYLLSTPESLIYNAAIDMVGPLINKRAIRADYCTANARQLQSIYHYQRTVLNAHIEVVNHITKVENYGRSIEVKKEQLKSLEASVDVANKLFQNARAEYVEVLLAQRELMEAKMQLIETKQQQLEATVNAYQALGGGGF